jgi:hypothetical protein
VGFELKWGPLSAVGRRDDSCLLLRIAGGKIVRATGRSPVRVSVSYRSILSLSFSHKTATDGLRRHSSFDDPPLLVVGGNSLILEAMKMPHTSRGNEIKTNLIATAVTYLEINFR